VRKNKGTGSASTVLDFKDSHVETHDSPVQRTLHFDLVAPASHDFRKALDVFARRLTARDIKSDTRGGG
jgi:hypothetical protein